MILHIISSILAIGVAAFCLPGCFAGATDYGQSRSDRVWAGSIGMVILVAVILIITNPL